ncbi:MAG: lamin tail domain-containing protein, partial [Anaerolineales bacterium]|nr:lamin tail domain-containing protein [Anaerolineales bacterium]
MSKHLSRLFSFVMILALMLMAAPIQSVQAAAPTELFLSEYIEGSSFNKAVEIYNGTGGSVNLSTYTLELYSNGASSPSQSVALSGTLADGDVFVLAHGSADAAILAEADLISSSVINFNGDDALVLKNGGAVVDSFGQVGVDPGSQWPGGGQDDTLRRSDTVCAGDTNPTDSFDASVEWVTFAQNTFDGLGSHTANCNGGGGPSTPVIVINEIMQNPSAVSD